MRGGHDREGDMNAEGRLRREEGRGHRGHGRASAQTFRRGRALAFLERLQVMRSTLAAQLERPEFEAIAPVIGGELKAVDQIMQAFIHAFELQQEADESAPSS